MRLTSIRGASTIIAIAAGAFVIGCSSQPTTATPPASVEPSAALVATLSPEPSPSPTSTPTPRPTPSAAPATSPATSPAPAGLVVDDFVWAWDKPLTLTGTAGDSRWNKVLFGSQTVDLRWTAKPTDASGCTLSYEVTSSLAKPVKGSVKAKSAKAASAKKAATPKYGDGTVAVATDCASWTLKVVPTGHPNIKIKKVDSKFKTTGSTAEELNAALAKAWMPWTLSWQGRYRSSSPIRVVSLTPTARLRFKVPSWQPPEGTDPELIESWKAASAGMRHHLDGQAAMAIQAAGRFRNAAYAKRSFSSAPAARKYYNKVRSRYFDQWIDRATDYNETTQFGSMQGAFIE